MTQQAHTMPEPVAAQSALALPASLPLLGEIELRRAVDRTTTRAEEDASIDARIASLRKVCGLTQKALAERLAVSTDELFGITLEARSSGGVKNRRLSRRLQAIDASPKRDQEALLRTFDAFISKTA